MPKYKEVNWYERTGKGYEVSVDPFGIVWYRLDGEYHRTDGPAIIWPDGHKSWYLNGKRVYKKDFTIEMVKQLNASELFTAAELAKMRLENA